MRCLAVMFHAPAPPHQRHLPRAKSCLALFPNPTTATLRHRTSDPDALSILSLLAFHHSHQALAVTLSFPHRPSTPHSTLPSMMCVLKRFPLTSPRKLALTCVKWSFLRTQSLTELHNYPHVAPQVSQCHVHAVPGSDVPCPCTIGSSRARNLVLPCFPTPQFPPFAIPHLTPDTLSILSLLTFPHSPSALSIPLSSPHWPYQILATCFSMACVKRGFLRTAVTH